MYSSTIGDPSTDSCSADFSDESITPHSLETFSQNGSLEPADTTLRQIGHPDASKRRPEDDEGTCSSATSCANVTLTPRSNDGSTERLETYASDFESTGRDTSRQSDSHTASGQEYEVPSYDSLQGSNTYASDFESTSADGATESNTQDGYASDFDSVSYPHSSRAPTDTTAETEGYESDFEFSTQTGASDSYTNYDSDFNTQSATRSSITPTNTSSRTYGYTSMKSDVRSSDGDESSAARLEEELRFVEAMNRALSSVDDGTREQPWAGECIATVVRGLMVMHCALQCTIV